MKLLNIVYIDDEPDLLEIFQETFSSSSIHIEIFSDPQRALEFIKNHPPDLIFIDYRLPNVTGDKLAILMNNQIPKALVSGDLIFNECSHFVTHFPKPYPVELIRNFIHKFEKS